MTDQNSLSFPGRDLSLLFAASDFCLCLSDGRMICGFVRRVSVSLKVRCTLFSSSSCGVSDADDGEKRSTAKKKKELNVCECVCGGKEAAPPVLCFGSAFHSASLVVNR